jgi:hypothetical protein
MFAVLAFVASALQTSAPRPAIRPYVPPVLEPEPEPIPSAASVVEIVPPEGDKDALVLARPAYAAPMVGHVLRGARIAVRGELAVENPRGCRSQRYYALEPFGWICSTQTRETTLPATTDDVLQVAEGATLPFSYVMVAATEGESLPMWRDLAALRAYEEPERQLQRGDTVAVRPQLARFEGSKYYVAVDDKVIPFKGTFPLPPLSDWQGVQIDTSTHLPFAWVTRKNAPVVDAPRGKLIERIARRERVDVLEEQRIGRSRWLRIGDGRWMAADHLNEVRTAKRPARTSQNPQWLDVDLGEQVVVAYLDDTPVYATLISSGKEPNHTPRGDYPIWGKVSAITMKSQQYDDAPYYVNKVPWVLFFQAHNALHGAYWHDLFGVVKSHGCANLAPKDARYLFEWLQPALPAGWTAVRNFDLSHAPIAHVYDSSLRRPFVQERNVGPPDKDEEAERLTQAIARREAEERERAAQAAQASAGVDINPAVPPPSIALSPALAPLPAMATPTVPDPTPPPNIAATQ